VVIRDGELRAQVAAALREEGWAVVDSPSGYHLLQSIAGPVLGEAPWRKPELVVVDAFSPGCSGLTIARGVRELGWSLSVVLIVNSAEHRSRVVEDADNSIYVADREFAVRTAIEVARARARSEHEPPSTLETSDDTGEEADSADRMVSGGDRRALA